MEVAAYLFILCFIICIALVIFHYSNTKNCHFCKIGMPKKATVCPHCGRDVG